VRRDTIRVPVRLAVGVALAGASWGCAADKLRISSHPPGAEVFIDDQFVGTTPVAWEVSRAQHGTRFHVRLEDKGYAPYETDARTVVSGGRVALAILTSAISLAFQKPSYYRPIEATLRPLREGEQPGAAPERAPARTGDSAVRLRQLEQLHDQGLITDEEYERKRRAILNEL